MTTATSTRPSPRTPWPAHPQSRASPRTSTTPHSLPTRTPGSVGQPIPPPLLSSKIRSPSKQQDQRTSSPSYFGLVVEPNRHPADSNIDGHVKNNWSPPTASILPAAAASPKPISIEPNQEFEAFRRQSESKSFSLGHGNLSHFSAGQGAGLLPTLGNLARQDSAGQTSPRTKVPENKESQINFDDSEPMDVDIRRPALGKRQASSALQPPSFFDLPRNESPSNDQSMQRPNIPRNQLSHLDDRHPRLSLPENRIDPPSPPVTNRHLNRADTLPSSLEHTEPVMISAHDLAALLESDSRSKVLLLDLRVAPQYVLSRIIGAMNLCIPTTLLKRPSFNVQKLADTFTKPDEKEKFLQWRRASYIVVYDAHSSYLKDATSSVNTLKKFAMEGWHGSSCVLRGGYLEFSKKSPDMVDRESSNQIEDTNVRSLSIDANMPPAIPLAGGCLMPATMTVANPFFGNIRQNMDLMDGVGQVSIERPAILAQKDTPELPAWLRNAIDMKDNGKLVADRFLNIERDEQTRMQKALSAHVSYGSPPAATPQSVQIAGIEKGTKNRYKDMLPYDHSRVKLQNVPLGGCDYVNASHVKAKWSNKVYIASQAPVPTTFEDFWRVVWEQDVRVIVMLTAEFDGGQRKCHPYWIAGDYGAFKVKSLSEKRVSLDPNSKFSPPLRSPSDRSLGSRRRSTTPHTIIPEEPIKDAKAPPPEEEVPCIIVRKLTLSHTGYPFEPLREMTQIQYSSWPDFGIPTHPKYVLGLIEQCDAVFRSYPLHKGVKASMPQRSRQRPIVVHCSAGCGRTGTFCTVDSVIDMLKRQRVFAERRNSQTKSDLVTDDDDDDDDDDDWIKRDDIDLVAKTVEEFRSQRLSMVQTLKQYVLCYETVLEWIVKEMPENHSKESSRRSYQG